MRYGRMMGVFLALMASASGALAQEGALAHEVLVETDAQAIVAQQREIREQATAGTGRYKDMDRNTRLDLFAKQDRVFFLLEGKTDSTELRTQDQLALFNALEGISAILNKAEDERMICERTRKVGSNRPVSVCKTVAQRRAERDATRDLLDRRDFGL